MNPFHFHYVLSLSVVYIIMSCFYTYVGLLGIGIRYDVAALAFSIFLIGSHTLFMPLHVLGIMGTIKAYFFVRPRSYLLA